MLAGQHEPQVAVLAPQQRDRLEQPLVVLVRPRVRRVEQERLARNVGRRETLEVDAQVDRAHPLGLERQPLDERLARVLRDRDHDPRPAGARAVERAPVRELPAREVLREELVLEVEDRRRRGRVGRRAAASRSAGSGRRRARRARALAAAARPGRASPPSRASARASRSSPGTPARPATRARRRRPRRSSARRRGTRAPRPARAPGRARGHRSPSPRRPREPA